jgi:hypothetical protein
MILTDVCSTAVVYRSNVRLHNNQPRIRYRLRILLGPAQLSLLERMQDIMFVTAQTQSTTPHPLCHFCVSTAPSVQGVDSSISPTMRLQRGVTI